MINFFFLRHFALLLCCFSIFGLSLPSLNVAKWYTSFRHFALNDNDEIIYHCRKIWIPSEVIHFFFSCAILRLCYVPLAFSDYPFSLVVQMRRSDTHPFALNDSNAIIYHRRKIWTPSDYLSLHTISFAWIALFPRSYILRRPARSIRHGSHLHLTCPAFTCLSTSE